MPSLHVLTHRQALTPNRIGHTAVIVLDILFATSSIVSAFDAGAETVLLAPDIASARQRHAEVEADRFVLAGEDHGERPPGFESFAPLGLRQAIRPGQSLIYATTNGTPALLDAANASALYAGALLNLPALSRLVATRHRGESVLIVCAGSLGSMNLEDFYAAGGLVEHLLGELSKAWSPTDAARAAQGLFRSQPPARCLGQSRVGRMMRERGQGEEVDYASRIGEINVVPQWSDDRRRLVRAAG